MHAYRRLTRGRLTGWFLALTLGAVAARTVAQDASEARPSTWFAALRSARAALEAAPADSPARQQLGAELWQQCQDEFPIECDWALQDFGTHFPDELRAASLPRVAGILATKVLPELGADGERFRQDLRALEQGNAAPEDPRWLELYANACQERRRVRLRTVLERAPRIVFTKHRTIRPSFFAYTEGQSDAQNERHFLPGAELCLLELAGTAATVRTLVSDPAGAIRDPAVSWDGRRVVFAWKKALNEDDYHLYELEVSSGWVRPITFGLGFADYEPAYLPNGDLIFASTRCVQRVDCWWTEVSNLYTCDADGRHLRRLGFDQVHAIFPQVLDDGRVIYTRWDYNDRGQIYPQPLFQMHADGTGQTEFYGNNSWFPTTIAHARGIPGSQKVVAILCGHHSSQAGKLALIDPAAGRHENQGVQLIAPVRPTRAERIDSYGQTGELWQYPYPLNEREFLVTGAPLGWDFPGHANRRRGDADFAIYWTDVDGRRELLAHDHRWPCQQPVPLTPRTPPMKRPSGVDYARATGTFYVQDVYAGAGLAGIPRGTVTKLRVVALDFSPAGIGNNGSGGPGGGALISTPISIGNGCWDVKVVLGETRVYEDGSAFCTVPARTPLYFQAIDRNGHAVQSMRSWSTLQPGENQSCVGCHEHKNSAPPTQGYRGTRALQAGPQSLVPFYGPPRGFSFPKEIQPIFDRHCTRCHYDRNLRPKLVRLPDAITREADPDWRPSLVAARMQARTAAAAAAAPATLNAPAVQPAFSLLGDACPDPLAKRLWSDAYLNLTLAQPDGADWARGAFRGVYDGRMVNWIGSQSIPAPLPPYAAGACRSELFPLLARGHYGVALSREERDKLACWIDLLVPFCGDYTEANAWTAEERQKYDRYLAKRQRMEQIEAENVAALTR